MQTFVSDTLLDSIARMTRQEQGATKEAVFDFQTRPDSTGGAYHRVDKAPQSGFWSYRVNQDIRLIVYQEGQARVLCYADHHDAAYDWAMRHRVRHHPATGAVQLVRVERTVEHVVERRVTIQDAAPAVFARHPDDYLLALGVPPQWLDAVRIATEDNLLELLQLLPSEVQERLMDLYDGKPVPRPVTTSGTAGWDHPDTRRHFQVVDDQQLLRQALTFPWDRWIVFLHPAQEGAVNARFAGPAVVSGGAGTGKTVVALHRAVRLARRSSDAKVLLTTYSRTLAAKLQRDLGRLLGGDEQIADRITVRHIHQLAMEILGRSDAQPEPAPAKAVGTLLRDALHRHPLPAFSPSYIETEWWNVIEPWDIRDWPTYRTFARTGRGSALGARQRHQLWPIFAAVRDGLAANRFMTWGQIARAAADRVANDLDERYAHVVVDESQDFGPSELTLVRALALPGPDDLFLCGDGGQRIFVGRFTWAQANIDVRGRSRTLRVNYRTTEQIRRFADRMRQHNVDLEADPLSNTPDAISLLSGPEPELLGHARRDDEVAAVGAWVRARVDEGFRPEEIAIFARARHILDDRAVAALARAGVPGVRLDDDDDPPQGAISLATMHRAKGLEFRVVVCMGCEDAQLPSSSVLREIDEPAERAAAVERERNVLYVASTRARERLLVTWTGQASPLLRSVG